MSDTNVPAWRDPDRIAHLAWDEKEIKPCQDQVVIRLDPPPTTAAGIIIPESAQRNEKVTTATVVAVGPGAFDKRGRRIPLDVQAGDRVLVRGSPGWICGPYRVLRQGAIDGVVEYACKECGDSFSSQVELAEHREENGL